jgi:tRNA(Ile)-lysidine synthase
MMKQTYILAVSGGVDSVVLLHKLMAVRPAWINYVVAHVDHGIRADSSADAAFVRALAASYELPYEQCELQLGSGASENVAREKRYDFLFALKKQYKSEAIVTAHHQDDVLETMVLNILRGTSPRGLIGFSRTGIVRPLMQTPKSELLAYAEKNGLEWREDSTNQDKTYLRNYVRLELMPKLDAGRTELLAIRKHVEELYTEIDLLTKALLVQSTKKSELVRARFVILPLIVQYELLATWLRLYSVSFDRQLLKRATLAMKVLEPGKQFVLGPHAALEMQKKTIVLKVQGSHV